MGTTKKIAGTLKEPSIIGAVIDLGRCLDLLDSSNLSLLKTSYDLFVSDSESLKKPIPKNENNPRGVDNDKVMRYLDCAG